MWIAFERMVYAAPRERDLIVADRLAAPEFDMLYNGTFGMENLWKRLLLQQTPHLQVVWRAPDGKIRLIAESHVAIPSRSYFCHSLSVALGRQRVLFERAKRRIQRATSPCDFPLVEISEHLAETSTADVIRFALGHLSEKFANQFHKRLQRKGHWGIAVNNEGLPRDLSFLRKASAPDNANWCLQIPSPTERFYADPFPWRDADGRYHLFFEDLPYDTNKGVISHVALDPATNTWKAPPHVVLERPYHLSYPFIFAYEGNVFMVPETSNNRTIEIYRAAPFPSAWVLHTVLMENIVAADTTLYYESGIWWLFTTIEQGEGPNWDELYLYHAPTPFGPWHAHPMNPIVSDCRRARMAGNIFRDVSNRLIRPAQNCEREYGSALWFCEITELSPTAYAETPLFSKEPPPAYVGFHTWNRVGEITVVDIKMNIKKRAKAKVIYRAL
ncbi:hypothetical protein AWB67_06108 [Caballeronia terrestris]|uniref:Glucosamine inositolphosphorylceramide transferase 1 N-terminal domain-containing protein n=2 Tax=Caballeronia terrestris TaxID=1226301 RepID=A0A158KMS0_9BURK|nr:hypothetical protein AWB67_06108 [Caballeronia terrestris]